MGEAGLVVVFSINKNDLGNMATLPTGQNLLDPGPPHKVIGDSTPLVLMVWPIPHHIE